MGDTPDAHRPASRCLQWGTTKRDPLSQKKKVEEDATEVDSAQHAMPLHTHSVEKEELFPVNVE